MKLLYIEWIDSAGCDSGWISIDTVREKHGAIRCYSIGWLARECKESVTLVSHIAGSPSNPHQANNDLSIPKVSILKRRVIRL